MNTLAMILPWVAAIAAGALYYFKLQQVKSLDQEKEELFERERKAYKDNMNTVEDLFKQKEKILNEKRTIQEEFSNRILSLEAENSGLTYDLQILQNLIQEGSINASPTVENWDEPFTHEYFQLEFASKIDWSTIELSLKDLIGNDKLYEVFISLLKSNLLPASIEDHIDYQRDLSQVVIWTQSFNDQGEPTRSLTWKEITSQILTKKQIVTDYLNGVIQDSDRAMVVHQALTNKPRKEAANA